MTGVNDASTRVIINTEREKKPASHSACFKIRAGNNRDFGPSEQAISSRSGVAIIQTDQTLFHVPN